MSSECSTPPFTILRTFVPFAPSNFWLFFPTRSTNQQYRKWHLSGISSNHAVWMLGDVLRVFGVFISCYQQKGRKETQEKLVNSEWWKNSLLFKLLLLKRQKPNGAWTRIQMVHFHNSAFELNPEFCQSHWAWQKLVDLF